MPHKTWTHICPKYGNERVWIGKPKCDSCGKTGKYGGLSIGVVAHMCNYNRLTGLPSLDRSLAGSDFYLPCPACQGKSFIEWNNGDDWVFCQSCEETGYIICVSQKRFDEIQRKVWEAFDQQRLEKATTPYEIDSILYHIRNRKLKKIYKRDHHAPKPTRRELRYKAKMNAMITKGVAGDE